MDNFMDNLVPVVIILVIVGLVLSVPILYILNLGQPNSGQHTGFVTAVEQNGIIWKTYTAYFKTNTQSSQEDLYCVTDPDVVTLLKSKQESGEKITVTYGRGFTEPIWQCNEEASIINGVK